MKAIFIDMALLAGMVLLANGISFGDQPADATNHEIRVGMNLDAAHKVLKEFKIMASEPKQFLAPKDANKDVGWSFFLISHDIELVFAYSTTTRKILHINVYYRHQPYNKLNEVMVPARSIRFEPDGSYIVHCEKPRK